MKLRAIRLHNVRRFTDRGVAIENIDDGVNVLAEANEHGKSTAFDAVHALFFQPHKGRPKPIQLLQPYSKGPVTVEADIEMAEGEFRLRKRWLGSAQSQVIDNASGRIIAQADEADQWIGEKIRGGATGPAGLLWVQQGVVEMGRGTGKTADTEKSAREDVLTSVAGEIETLTGGRRTTQILAKCYSELDAHVTGTGRPKSGGAYFAALQERDALKMQVDDLTTRVGALREDLDHRSRARKRLAELKDAETLARDAKALEEADAALKQGEVQAGELEKAQLAENLAKQERDSAKDALERFEAARKAVAELQIRIADEQTALDAIATSHADAKQAEEKAVDTVRECREALHKSEADLVDTNAAVEAQDAAQRLEARMKIFSDADAAHREAETARAKVLAREIPAANIQALKKSEDRIATLKAEMRAFSMSVRADYVQSAAALIRANGVTLTDGTDIAVERTTQFEVEGIGTLTVTPGAGHRTGDLERELQAATDQRAGLLADMGVSSLSVAHAQTAEVDEYLRNAERNEARRDALAPDGLDVLRVEIEALTAKAGSLPQVPVSVGDCTARRDGARTARDRAEDIMRSSTAAFGESDRKRTAAETNLRRSKEALSRETAQFSDDVDLQVMQQSLVDALSEKSTGFEDAHRVADSLQQVAPDIDSLRAIQKRAASVVESIRQEAQTLAETVSQLSGSINARASEGIEEEQTALIGQRDRVKQRVEELETEITTLQHLRDVLTEAKADAKEHFFEPVVKELRPLLGIVFGDTKVTFDEATMLPVTVEREGAVESFDVLSGGMREQITILTRLAFARLLAQDGRTVPVILDDALIYSDDERIERMFDALHRHADDLQILVFTCRQRAFQKLGGRALSMKDWAPAE